MERFFNFKLIVFAIVFVSLKANIHAQPTTKISEPTENVENETGVPLPPLILPKTNYTGKLADVPPLVFPDDNNSSVPLYKLPPLIFPSDNTTFTVIPPLNQTALKILNTNKVSGILHPGIESEYYTDESKESEELELSLSDEIEEVQEIDKKKEDGLEENYKFQNNALPNSDIDDNTEVDHPLLKHTHIISIVAAGLAALCACIYIVLIIWKRMMFNRYGMRERLINEDDFYSHKSNNRNI